MEVRAHIIAFGLVQGVGFRWFVAHSARSLDVKGYVRNRADGSVEIVAEGEEGLVNDLIRQVKIGPSAARVTDLRVDRAKIATDDRKGRFQGFEIR